MYNYIYLAGNFESHSLCYLLQTAYTRYMVL